MVLGVGLGGRIPAEGERGEEAGDVRLSTNVRKRSDCFLREQVRASCINITIMVEPLREQTTDLDTECFTQRFACIGADWVAVLNGSHTHPLNHPLSEERARHDQTS